MIGCFSSDAVWTHKLVGISAYRFTLFVKSLGPATSRGGTEADLGLGTADARGLRVQKKDPFMVSSKFVEL